jgi:uncharacterized membrane protein YgcG
MRSFLIFFLLCYIKMSQIGCQPRQSTPMFLPHMMDLHTKSAPNCMINTFVVYRVVAKTGSNCTTGYVVELSGFSNPKDYIMATEAQLTGYESITKKYNKKVNGKKQKVAYSIQLDGNDALKKWNDSYEEASIMYRSCTQQTMNKIIMEPIREYIKANYVILGRTGKKKNTIKITHKLITNRCLSLTYYHGHSGVEIEKVKMNCKKASGEQKEWLPTDEYVLCCFALAWIYNSVASFEDSVLGTRPRSDVIFNAIALLAQNNLLSDANKLVQFSYVKKTFNEWMNEIPLNISEEDAERLITRTMRAMGTEDKKQEWSAYEMTRQEYEQIFENHIKDETVLGSDDDEGDDDEEEESPSESSSSEESDDPDEPQVEQPPNEPVEPEENPGEEVLGLGDLSPGDLSGDEGGGGGGGSGGSESSSVSGGEGGESESESGSVSGEVSGGEVSGGESGLGLSLESGGDHFEFGGQIFEKKKKYRFDVTELVGKENAADFITAKRIKGIFASSESQMPRDTEKDNEGKLLSSDAYEMIYKGVENIKGVDISFALLCCKKGKTVPDLEAFIKQLTQKQLSVLTSTPDNVWVIKEEKFRNFLTEGGKMAEV